MKRSKPFPYNSLNKKVRHFDRFVLAFAVLFLGGSLVSEPSYSFVMRLENVVDTSPGAVLTPLGEALRDQFNNSIVSPAQSEVFLTALSNANAGSSRSLLFPGVIGDSKILVGLHGAASVALGASESIGGIGSSSNSLPGTGFGAKTGLTIGLSNQILRLPIPLDPSRLMWGVSFFTMNLSPYLNGVSLKSSQFGLGMSYLVQAPIGWNPIVRWNGVRVSSGLTYSGFEVGYTTPFSLSQDAGGGVSIDWVADVNLGAKSWLLSWSTEASTGIRLFWVFNLYTGMGLDFNAGGTSYSGGSTGTITSNPAGPPGYSADAIIEPSSTSYSPTLASIRYFIGSQIDLGPVGIYAQAQMSLPSVYTANFGAQFQF